MSRKSSATQPSTSSILKLLLTVSALFLKAPGVEAQNQCHLCPRVQDLVVPDRWGYSHQGWAGKNCFDYYMETANLDMSVPANKGNCESMRSRAQSICCDPTVDPATVGTGNIGGGGADAADAVATAPSAATIAPAPTGPPPLPAYVGPVGREGTCGICGNPNEYPGIPGQTIIARYVGIHTCDELFHRGRHGMIPDFMCGPTQDFAYSVCGCGIFNPDCAGDATKCFGKENYQPPYMIPTPSPTMQPSSSPAPSPRVRNSLTAAPIASPGKRNLRRETPKDLHFEIQRDSTNYMP